ncbi:MAG: hypothetical protein J0G32_05790 [Alphaproteobacteria bacterium]|nr:hypothetical protein [Alphaproteobacteria bacterium]OJV16034.1 MAG: hypothetical protein BGO27_04215 [Alphaproteobacteria bacterium 33-17]
METVSNNIEAIDKPNLFDKIVIDSIEKIDANSKAKFKTEKASTPMIYQAIINLLHYKCKIDLPPELKIYVDDGKKYYKIGNSYDYYNDSSNFECGTMYLSYGKESLASPDLESVNNKLYIETLIRSAANTALEKEIVKISSKYKLSDADQKDIKDLLKNLFEDGLYEGGDNITKISQEIRSLILHNRLEKYIAKDMLEENFDALNNAVINNDKDLMKSILSEMGVSEKYKQSLLKNFGKFIETTENSEQIMARIEDLVKSELHSEIASEIRIFNDIKEIEFCGYENVWRGLDLPSNFDINILFEQNHRPPKGYGSYLDYHVMSPYTGNITGDYNATTSTSWDLEVAISFAVNNPYTYHNNKKAYVLDIRPKSGEHAVFMANYNILTGIYEREISFEHIDIHNIYGAYEIETNNSRYLVKDFIANPHYIKRPMDDLVGDIEVGDQLYLNPITQATTILRDGKRIPYDPIKDWVLNMYEELEEYMSGNISRIEYDLYEPKDIETHILEQIHTNLYS